MIHQISSDLGAFKTLNFQPGLNILLADKSEGATDLQSRNGAGKTSFVEIVHFLCGSTADNKSIFRSDTLLDFSFQMNVDIGGNKVDVKRSGAKPNRVQVKNFLQKTPSLFNAIGENSSEIISNGEWCDKLGASWFLLNQSSNLNAKNGPSFRSLFSYFARRQSNGGFQNSTQHSTQQAIWNQQVNLSYLLGLDWQISRDIQALRDKEKNIKSLVKAMRLGELGPYLPRTAELRTKAVVVSRRVDQLRERIDTFQVVPEYSELEIEASKITGEIKQLGDENFVDRRLIDELNTSLNVETPPDDRDLTKLYNEAGIVLPESVIRRLNEAKQFHHSIIQNRRSHLQAELNSAVMRIEEREEKKKSLDFRRSQIMKLLQSGGALEHYTSMREELGRAEADAEAIRQNLQTSEKLDRSKAEHQIERSHLIQALSDDIRERGEFLEDAIICFEELSQSLYEQAGNFTIDASSSGPKFEVKIESQRSKGITNMQIFCFDLMLTELCTKSSRSPGFLIHDSHIFDGVDERQVAKALQVGAERAKRNGFQYIVTMNSDAIPRDGFRSGFDINEYILPVRLTDATDDGGLFGIRF